MRLIYTPLTIYVEYSRLIETKIFHIMSRILVAKVLENPFSIMNCNFPPLKSYILEYKNWIIVVLHQDYGLAFSRTAHLMCGGPTVL